MAARLATKAELIAFAPTLCGENREPAETILELTGSMISIDCWGVKASRGHLLLAAHFLKLLADSGGGASAGGPLAGRGLGKISESYAVATQADAELASTTYGQLYLALRKSLFLLPITGRAC